MVPNMTLKDQILEWSINGNVGVSSQAMAAAVLGIQTNSSFGNAIPSDPSDFNRCLLLIQAAPDIKKYMYRVACISSSWAKIVNHWVIIEESFRFQLEQGEISSNHL